MQRGAGEGARPRPSGGAAWSGSPCLCDLAQSGRLAVSVQERHEWCSRHRLMAGRAAAASAVGWSCVDPVRPSATRICSSGSPRERDGERSRAVSAATQRGVSRRAPVGRRPWPQRGRGAGGVRLGVAGGAPATGGSAAAPPAGCLRSLATPPPTRCAQRRRDASASRPIRPTRRPARRSGRPPRLRGLPGARRRGRAARARARGDRAGLLRRPLAERGGRAAGAAAGHREDAYAQRAGPAGRSGLAVERVVG